MVKEELAKGRCRNRCSGPRVRTVTACQARGPSGCIDTYTWPRNLMKDTSKRASSQVQVCVTGRQNNCLKAEENDVESRAA